MSFTPRALSFFREVGRHNEKPWFGAHRDEYEAEVRQPMRELIEDLDTLFARFVPEIGGDPKRSMFRIYRDIRFSKDKSPYKARAACWFHHLKRITQRRLGGGYGECRFLLGFKPASRR